MPAENRSQIREVAGGVDGGGHAVVVSATLDCVQLPPEAFQQDGRFTYHQARAAGITHHALYRALKHKVLEQHGHGVFVLADGQVATDPVAAHRFLVRDAQLSAERRRWYAARRSALVLMGIPIIGTTPTRPQLVRDAGDADGHGRDRHARVSTLPAAHRWEFEGVDMTTAARTVVDVARQESFRNAVVAADAVLRRGVTRDDLDEVLRTMRRWPGVAKARTAVRFADGRAESPGESLTRVCCSLEGLPIPEPQVEIYRNGVFVARTDLLLREQLLAVESDGAFKFTEAGVLPQLIGRQESIEDCGIHVLRTNWGETFKDSSVLGHRLRERLRERGPRRLPPGVELRSTVVRPIAPLLGWSADLAA
jgi:hypothetical protein